MELLSPPLPYRFYHYLTDYFEADYRKGMKKEETVSKTQSPPFSMGYTDALVDFSENVLGVFFIRHTLFLILFVYFKFQFGSGKFKYF